MRVIFSPVPKPPPTPKKAPKWLQRGGPPRRTNPARKVSRFTYSYGSVDRVLWVHTHPCAMCGTVDVPRRNCHLRTRAGSNIKGPADSIIPGCDRCHDRLDGRAQPPFTETEIAAFWQIAAQLESDWRVYASSTDQEK